VGNSSNILLKISTLLLIHIAISRSPTKRPTKHMKTNVS